MSWARTQKDLEECFRRWGVREWSTVPVREPLSVEGKAVTLRYVQNGQERRFTLATQPRAVDNLRCLYLGVDSIRLNEARGIGDVVREMYQALPSPTLQRDPYEVLGVRSDAELEDIEAVYRSKAKRLHPDKEGDDAAMKELNGAMERIREERKVPV